MQSCPICYQRTKQSGARPHRRSLSRVAAADLIECREQAAMFLNALNRPLSGRMAQQFAVSAAHAANHLLTSSPVRYSRMLEATYVTKTNARRVGDVTGAVPSGSVVVDSVTPPALGNTWRPENRHETVSEMYPIVLGA